MARSGRGPGESLDSWAHLNIKTVFPRYGDSHVKDKMVAKHGDPYIGKTTALYWDGRLVTYPIRPPEPEKFGIITAYLSLRFPVVAFCPALDTSEKNLNSSSSRWRQLTLHIPLMIFVSFPFSSGNWPWSSAVSFHSGPKQYCPIPHRNYKLTS